MTEIVLLKAPQRDHQLIEDTYIDVTVREGVFATAAFQIGLPKTWIVKTCGPEFQPSVDTPIVELAHAMPNTDKAIGASHNAMLRVWCVLLPREVNGSDWLVLWASSQNMTIHDMRTANSSNGIMGDAVMTSVTDGALHRVFTIKDGDLLYLVDGSIDPKGEPANPNLQEIALMAAIRFKLLAPSGAKYAEPMKEERIGSIHGELVFMIPQSWDARQSGDAPSEGAAFQYVTRLDGVATGNLVVALGGPGMTAEALEDVLVAKLAHQGQHYAAAIQVLDATSGDYHCSTWTRQTNQSETGAKFVMLSMRGQRAGVPVSAALVTPSPETSFEAYAVNRRMFEILIETHNLTAAASA